MTVVRNADAEFVEHVLELLNGFGAVNARRMFGGSGLFRDGFMFALISDGLQYLKADALTRSAFVAAGCPAFRYTRRDRVVEMAYYEAPESCLEDADAMQHWARIAWDAALRAGRARNRRRGS